MRLTARRSTPLQSSAIFRTWRTVMDYQRQYDLLIQSRRRRVINKGYDRHHINPRCIGGSDCKDNIIRLTPKEHFIAHLLLAKIHGGVLWYPVHLMARRVGKGSRHYKRMRDELRVKRSEKANRQWADPEMRDKMSAGMRGRVLSPESRAEVSEKMKAKWADPEYREMATKARQGRVMSPEARKRMSEAQQRRRANERL